MNAIILVTFSSFAENFNDIFKSVILQQFCISSIVVSVSVYQLSTRPEKNMEFIMCFFYLICVLTEFLVYCWFGNEVMFQVIKGSYRIETFEEYFFSFILTMILMHHRVAIFKNLFMTLTGLHWARVRKKIWHL